MRYIDNLSRWTGKLGALLILLMVAIVVYEVFVRYVLGAPTIWANELNQLLFGAVFFLCGADALRVGAHVQVDVILSSVSPRKRAMMNLWAHALSLLFLCVFAYILHGPIWESIVLGQTTRSSWDPPLWPNYLVVAVAIAAMAFQCVSIISREILVIRNGAKVRNGAEQVEGP